MTERKQPMQPLEIVGNVIRFQENSLVRYLLDAGGLTLNDLAQLPNIPAEDWMQLAQLIGYSVNGYAELDYASDASVAKANRLARKHMRKQKRNAEKC